MNKLFDYLGALVGAIFVMAYCGVLLASVCLPLAGLFAILRYLGVIG